MGFIFWYSTFCRHILMMIIKVLWSIQTAQIIIEETKQQQNKTFLHYDR